ncbi:DNA-binding CsgD family transcriptional regulator [Symbiobacterium terraclitae]|uniref:DNA-binding CsgD family transcriptional regulator n=1 Tax=Symbiobacterium terraclitae TaxID=557451 RepID=A0ABS4JNQ7_9FIRM|nr:LuxR C-terminal-related transcriptional regulator [Symbiobacterium terraclitae]MBP2017187.1 DNA-binding CsgD family transcriptional regulator [Symbiobacterium terraclitae]
MSVAYALEKIWGPHLSQRELEVGRLVVAGYSTQKIAETLFISENTVKTHLRNLFRKTKTRSRIELYRKLVESGVAAPSLRTFGESLPDRFEPLFAELTAGRDGGACITAVVMQLEFQKDERPADPPEGIVDLLATSIRQRDHLFPWKEGLYLLVLPGSDRASSLDVAERLVRKLQRWAQLKGLMVRAAVGTAALNEGAGTAESVVELAARRLKSIHLNS